MFPGPGTAVPSITPTAPAIGSGPLLSFSSTPTPPGKPGSPLNPLGPSSPRSPFNL